MTTQQQLVTGLGGAIGSDFISSQNRLIFVEFDGKVSRFDLVRDLDAVVFTGSATMAADSSLDLQDGTSIHGGHIRWDHTSPGGARVMRPQGNCRLAYLGPVDYNAIGPAQLQDLAYSQASLNGEPGAGNQLATGAVFAVWNISVQPAANFDCAKVQVVVYGASLQVRWRTYRLRPAYQVLGTGYTQPEDVEVSADGQHAYVTERNGHFLRIDLANANRIHAQVVSAGLAAPHQIVLAEDRGYAFLVEYANPGRLMRITLSTGAQTVMADHLQFAIGLAMSSDLRFAYITEQAPGGGRLSRIDLATNARTVLVGGLTNPFFLTWADAGQAVLLTTLRDPADRLVRIDLTQAVMSAATIASVPFRPSSVAVISPLRLVVCSNTVLTRVDLSSSLFVATGPMILGIGHVPADRVFSGYADTTGDPGYFYQVKHAPFGGTLSLMVNHDHAFADGGRYYRIEVDGVAQTLSWNDYKWSTTTNRFELVSTSASFGSFFRVRQPQELWYNHWLGYRLDTSPLTNALHTITLKLYSAASLASLMSTHTLHVRIDNQWPTASIDAIFHDGAPVGTCGIVTSGSDRFVFRITANDPQGHLKSWALTAMWGDNHSAAVASASYVPPAPPAPPIWAGPVGATVPAAPGWPATVAGDPTSTRCAHTFYLGVWDRVIDGYDHLHYSAYHKSITIML